MRRIERMSFDHFGVQCLLISQGKSKMLLTVCFVLPGLRRTPGLLFICEIQAGQSEL